MAIEGNRRRGWQRMRWLDGINVSVDMNLSKFWERVEDRGAWHAAVCGVPRSQTWLSDGTTVVVMFSSHGNDMQSWELLPLEKLMSLKHLSEGPRPSHFCPPASAFASSVFGAWGPLSFFPVILLFRNNLNSVTWGIDSWVMTYWYLIATGF